MRPLGQKKDSGEAFGTAVVAPGAVTLVVTGIASGEGFGSHIVSAGVLYLVPSGVASGEGFGTAVQHLEILTRAGRRVKADARTAIIWVDAGPPGGYRYRVRTRDIRRGRADVCCPSAKRST